MEIVSLPVEYDKEKIDSKYRLVLIAAQRAKELAYGAVPRIQTKSKKYTTVAIEEALEDRLEFLTGDEARKARETAGKFDYRKLLEESRRAAAGEELSELERDLKVYLNERETVDKKAIDELFSEKSEENADE